MFGNLSYKTRTGTVSMLVSILLFIAPGKNKKLTLNMDYEYKNGKTTITERQSLIQTSYPAITLKIKL